MHPFDTDFPGTELPYVTGCECQVDISDRYILTGASPSQKWQAPLPLHETHANYIELQFVILQHCFDSRTTFRMTVHYRHMIYTVLSESSGCILWTLIFLETWRCVGVMMNTWWTYAGMVRDGLLADWLYIFEEDDCVEAVLLTRENSSTSRVDTLSRRDPLGSWSLRHTSQSSVTSSLKNGSICFGDVFDLSKHVRLCRDDINDFYQELYSPWSSTTVHFPWDGVTPDILLSWSTR